MKVRFYTTKATTFGIFDALTQTLDRAAAEHDATVDDVAVAVFHLLTAMMQVNTEDVGGNDLDARQKRFATLVSGVVRAVNHAVPDDMCRACARTMLESSIDAVFGKDTEACTAPRLH